MSGSTFRQAVYEQFGRVGKALSSPRRIELLDLLGQGPRTVEALARITGQSVANTSHHLLVLRASGLVTATKAGVFVTYRIADDTVQQFFDAVRRVTEARSAELARLTRDFLDERGLTEAVDRDALIARVRRGEAVVVDVRPTEEYRAGHIRGALSIPVAELRSRLRELPADREIVAYCRGPYCVMAADAVQMLRDQGFRAERLDESVWQWRQHGFETREGDTPS
jgi:rhodanese-related sulfurtransferase/DNA-binding transcriptional ArsR family regulator